MTMTSSVGSQQNLNSLRSYNGNGHLDQLTLTITTASSLAVAASRRAVEVAWLLNREEVHCHSVLRLLWLFWQK